MPKVLSVFGTRPEAIKLAPVIRCLAEDTDRLRQVVVVTAQHREMLDQVLRLFAITPDYDLDLMRAGQSPFEITTQAMLGLKPILETEQPDIVLVQGDTTTVVAASLAAYYLRIPIGHVEAGLRTYDKFQPFPEEMNRRLTSVLADLHFAPTPTAREHLTRENIPDDHIYVTGNTVIDALLSVAYHPYIFDTAPLNSLNFDQTRVLLVTAHRRENWGQPIRNICAAIRQLVQAFGDVVVVFSVHKNPAVRQIVEAELNAVARVHLVEPLDYEPFVHLMQRAYLILTDSGGIQEEAPSLGKPVLVLRNVTERPEGVAAGTLCVVGTDIERITVETARLLSDRSAYMAMAQASNPYGDGQAAQRIVDILEHWLAEPGV
ncbi:MAG: UDP-N-acetylglucosamine 2-epimerase (non-hydrolyzing) [Anaerolineae bacterium]|nr:UDP-N-acetylglucosamine 2-epimerase (non-hydrolyzing) [Anaerolineae bacterium]